MEQAKNAIEIYQFRVVLRETSPHLWRRLLVRSDGIVNLFHCLLLTHNILFHGIRQTTI